MVLEYYVEGRQSFGNPLGESGITANERRARISSNAMILYAQSVRAAN